mgnify:CR=1 FL=1
MAMLLGSRTICRNSLRTRAFRRMAPPPREVAPAEPMRALAVDGRIVVMSYQSLEDRITKRVLTEAATSTAPPDLPVVPAEHAPVLQLLTRALGETDLAELIVQLGHDTPSHILVPAIHRNRTEVRDIFLAEMDDAPPDLTDEPRRLAMAARAGGWAHRPGGDRAGWLTPAAAGS